MKTKIDYFKYDNKKYPFPVSPCCEEDLKGIEIKKRFYIGCPKCRKIWQLRKSDGCFYEVKLIPKKELKSTKL